MLRKPDLDDAAVAACVQAQYGLPVTQVTFLPLGADLATAVYRVSAGHAPPYFLKLRRGAFEPASVTLPKYLSDQGLTQIIAPLATQSGQLWGNLGAFKVILYPYIEGRDGYEAGVSAHHWHALGQFLKRLHTVNAPPALRAQLYQETYSPRWRNRVKMFMERVQADTWTDPVAAETAAYLAAKRSAILDLVGRAEQRAQALKAEPPASVVCHADLHAGNLLIGAAGALYIVDWDNPILAPKERDLMSVGGGLMGGGRPPLEEESLFYSGYGPTPIHPQALAYYRYERIVEDIAAYCDQLLLATEGAEDHRQSFEYLTSNFLPNHTIDIAYRTDRTP